MRRVLPVFLILACSPERDVAGTVTLESGRTIELKDGLLYALDSSYQVLKFTDYYGVDCSEDPSSHDKGSYWVVTVGWDDSGVSSCLVARGQYGLFGGGSYSTEEYWDEGCDLEIEIDTMASGVATLGDAGSVDFTVTDCGERNW